MKKDSVLWLITLARKAGKVEVGAFLSEKAIKAKKAELVIVARDSADNTKKAFYDTCKFYKTEIFEYGTKDTLGQFTGKENVSVVAVTDKNFANGMRKGLNKPE